MGAWDTSVTGVVLLPDGRAVRGRSLRGPAPAGATVPEFGLYLTARPYRPDGWESRWVCWPDFRLPRDPEAALAAVADAYARSATVKVELACGGGTGRTGTALALLARHAGIPAADAVAWARGHYRPHAAETVFQRRFVARAVLHS